MFKHEQQQRFDSSILAAFARKKEPITASGGNGKKTPPSGGLDVLEDEGPRRTGTND